MKKILVLVFVVGSLFAFNSINRVNSNVIEGKVIKAYTQTGFGRMQNEWLFMDVKSNDKIYHIAIAPTFRIPNLGINEGDIVKVNGFIPPVFPNGYVKAFDIYDVTQKKDYPISGYGIRYNHYENFPHNGYRGW